DAQPCEVCRIARGQHEHCLRQIELSCDPLHLIRPQSCGVEHHCQGVPRKSLVGEDIEGDEAANAHTVSDGKRTDGFTNSSWAGLRTISREPASVVRVSRQYTDEAARARATPTARLSRKRTKKRAATASPAPLTDIGRSGDRTRWRTPE